VGQLDDDLDLCTCVSLPVSLFVCVFISVVVVLHIAVDHIRCTADGWRVCRSHKGQCE